MAIKRIWHGWTTPENAGTYRKLLHEEVFPEIEAKDIPGYSSIELFRRDLDDEVEFVTMMTFRSLQNVIDFQGEDYERCYVPDAAQEVLKRWDRTASHFEALEIRNYDQTVRGARGGSRAPFDHDRRSERAAAEVDAKSDPFADEIRALHRFLDDWLKGRVERGDGEPARFADVLADDFVVIHPNGTRGDKVAAVGGFARAYGESPRTTRWRSGVSIPGCSAPTCAWPSTRSAIAASPTAPGSRAPCCADAPAGVSSGCSSRKHAPRTSTTSQRSSASKCRTCGAAA